MPKSIYIIVFALVLSSCSRSKSVDTAGVVARVDESYLYKKDIEALVPAGTSKEDSILLVRNYQNTWASQILLNKAAELNLNEERKKQFNALVRQYKTDLYTKAYIEEIVKRSVDTVVSEADLKKYYEEHKANFKTPGLLLRLRYINLPGTHAKLAQVRSRFSNFSKADRAFWGQYQPQFNQSALNDSVWVEMSEVYRRLPFINPENRDAYMTSGTSFEKQYKGNHYLVHIRQVIDRNSIAPFEYLKPTLSQIIVNRRKLELIKQFEKDIINDAIKNDKYEIY